MTDPVVLSEAAAYTPQPPEPHQKDAWDWVEALLTPAELMEFTELYRAAPEPTEPTLSPGDEFTHWITPNIQYGEVCIWNEERRFVNQNQCNSCIMLCSYLETVRAHFNGNPIIITSGHRPEPINAQVGGAINSEHTFNLPKKGAIDFCIEHANIYEVEKYVDETWPYSVGYGASRGFVHFGTDGYGTRKRWYY